MQRIILLALALIVNGSAMSCDICSCSNSSYFFGMIPQFQKNTVGARFTHSTFTHPNTALNFNQQSQVLKDQFQSFDIWSRIYLKPKWQLIAVIPFKSNTRFEQNQRTSISGVGDWQAMVNYKWLDQSDSLSKKTKHLFLSGLGVKLPTGTYQQRDRNLTMLPTAFQAGTGAFALQANLFYTLRHKRWGVTNQLFAQANATNELNYKMGDVLVWSTAMFYWFEKKQVRVLPQIGFGLEHYQADLSYKSKVANTGTQLLTFNLAAECYYKKMLFSAFVQIPASQSLAASQPRNNTRLGLNVGYFF